MGEDVPLVILAILCSGDSLERSGMSLVSELSCLREIIGLLSRIFVRVGFDRKSL